MIPQRTYARRALITGLLSFFVLLTQASAEKKLIEQVDIHEERLSDVATFLSETSSEMLGGKARNVLIDPNVDSSIEISLSLHKVSLSTVLGYVAEVSGLDYRVDRHAVVFIPRRGAHARSLPALRKGNIWVSKRLKAIRLKQIDFHEEPVGDVFAFLSKKSRELDLEKKGVNFVLTKGVDPTAKVTLKLNDVPLATVLKYVAEATDLRARVDAHAVTLLPSLKK